MIDINAKFSLINSALKKRNSGRLRDMSIGTNVVNGSSSDDGLMRQFSVFGSSPPTPVATRLWHIQGRSYGSAQWYWTDPGHNVDTYSVDDFVGNSTYDEDMV